MTNQKDANEPLQITSVSVTPGAQGFAVTGCPGATLSPGQSCKLTVVLSPKIMGATQASVLVNDNATGSPQTVALTGTGAPDISVSPMVVNFQRVPDTATRMTQPIRVTITNTTPVSRIVAIPLHIGAITFHPRGGWVTRACAKTNLLPQRSCTFEALLDGFGTAANLHDQHHIDIFSDAAQSPTKIIVHTTSGRAAPDISVSPAFVDFSRLPRTPETPPIRITITNTTPAFFTTIPLQIASIALAPGSAYPTSTCWHIQLAPQKSCTFQVRLNEGGSENSHVDVDVISNAFESPSKVVARLYSGAPAPDISVSPEVVTFPHVFMGMTPPIKVTITNTTVSPSEVNALYIGSITLRPSGAFVPNTGNCANVELSAHKSCTFQAELSYAPGNRTPYGIDIVSNAVEGLASVVVRVNPTPSP